MFPPAPQTDIYLIRRRATLTIEFKLALLGGWSPPDWQSMFGLVSEGAVKKVVAIIHEFLKKKKYHDKPVTVMVGEVATTLGSVWLDEDRVLEIIMMYSVTFNIF